VLLNKIRGIYRKANIWVSIKETADASGREVANVSSGNLKVDRILLEKLFILPRQEISALTHAKTGQCF
jgi:hypothetical protein